MFQKINLILILVFCNFLVSSQELEADFEKIATHLEGSTSFFIQADVSVFDKKGGAKLHEMKAKLYKSEKAQLNIIDDVENYSNEKYVVHVDHEEKLISILTKEQVNGNFSMDDVSQFDLKKIKKFIKEESKESGDLSTVKLISNNDNIKTYKISKNGEVFETIIKLDMNKLQILEISIEYDKGSVYNGQFVKLKYVSFTNSEDVSLFLKQNQYFTISNEKYILAAKYKNYQLSTGR